METNLQKFINLCSEFKMDFSVASNERYNCKEVRIASVSGTVIFGFDLDNGKFQDVTLEE